MNGISIANQVEFMNMFLKRGDSTSGHLKSVGDLKSNQSGF
jgi:hypothetical protein